MKARVREKILFAAAAVCILLSTPCAFAVTRQQPVNVQKAPEARALPSIQVKELVYDFGEVFEGAEVKHEFTVKNIGTAVLNIANVKPDCGCTVVRYDAAIPAGGEGKMTMKVNLRHNQGKVSKAVTIQSDDPRDPTLVVRMNGVVIPIIDVKPSTNVLFRGLADQLNESVLDLTGSVAPFHISGSETNITENIDYRLETVAEGKQYRLKVSNKTKQGNYSGFIKLNTDLAQKPDLIIRVTGFIEGEASVKPQTILIGKLSANQPERVGKIFVTSNRNKPFHITRLTYDQDLISVTQETAENPQGFVLEVKPKLDGVPAGSRKKATLTVETDLDPNEKTEVLVHLFNSSDQPEVQKK